MQASLPKRLHIPGAINENIDSEEDVVYEIMSKNILSMDASTTMEEARTFMKKNKIAHLGVTESGNIIVIISKSDLKKYFGNLYESN